LTDFNDYFTVTIKNNQCTVTHIWYKGFHFILTLLLHYLTTIVQQITFPT